ncbi:MAG: phosphate ABC transporter ATP-binding protein, partial [Chloroflexi bacterium]
MADRPTDLVTVAARESALAIEVSGLRKAYGQHVALHDLNLTVEPGEV